MKFRLPAFAAVLPVLSLLIAFSYFSLSGKAVLGAPRAQVTPQIPTATPAFPSELQAPRLTAGQPGENLENPELDVIYTPLCQYKMRHSNSEITVQF